MLDPASVFASPQDVLASTRLTREQKIDILLRWQQDAAEEAVALEEGMPGEESGLLRRVLLALHELAGSIDVEHTGPAKHHTVPRAALADGKRNRKRG